MVSFFTTKGTEQALRQVKVYTKILLLRRIYSAICHSLEKGNPSLDARFHWHDNRELHKTDIVSCNN